jgi:hypothetical protein
MARLLVQLKLRLLRNALNSSTAARVSFLFSSYGALIVAIGVFWVLCLLRGSSASVALTSVIFTGFALGWLILPIFAFGLDGTLDPAALALYPLRTRPLATGLLAASATGAWPVANVLGLLGVTVGLAHGPLGVLIAVVAVVLQVLFCIVLARFVTTGMAGLLRSRRGKDLAAFLIVPIVALYEFFAQVLPRLIADGGVCAGSRPAWPCIRSRMRRTGIWARPCCGWPCWPASSWRWAGCGSGRSAGRWSRPTPPPGRPRCGERRCRWPGTAWAVPSRPGSGFTSAVSRRRSCTGA